MLDTHCHLTYEGLYERVAQVVREAADAGVDRLITVGTTPEDAGRAVDLADRFEGVYATAGLHPHYADRWPDRTAVVEGLRSRLMHPRVVAIGEMGLDKHYPDPPLEVQETAFRWQLELAAEVSDPLPIIIHNRKATDEVLGLIRASGLPGERFVFHCFTGDDRELDAILGLGAMVGFTGIVTFRNARALAESAIRTPLDRLMVETDSPYLAPEPHRKVRPNQPRFVVEVARFLAEARGVELDEFTRQVDANAVRFFGLKRPDDRTATGIEST